MNESKEVRIFEDPESVAEAFALEFYHMISSSRQRFDIALSGGKTPKLLFEIFASEYSNKIPWERIHFWWGDERCVPPTDNESNYKMTQESLLSKINIDESQIHRIKGELSPDAAASDYILQIQSHLNERDNWPIFDLIILGMGDDGHTASIFPDQMEFLKSDKICEVATHPESGQKRVTLTGKVLNNANRVYFLVTGKSKAKRVSEIMNNLKKAQKLPAFHVEPAKGKTIFFFDQKAASKIS
ncbi:6-phosphogluconolactonase [Sunxiuqinia sp. A32]|uniref:6-phosphogluconolactonase n=1 Tax=Sunxiuqinia sp. A32 TaxID=3461496 RepID=UPI0040457CA9